MLLEIIVIITLFIWTIFIYSKWRFSYWKRRGVPFIKPRFPFGNSQNPLFRKYPFYYHLTKYYKKFKSKGYKFGGVYMLLNPRYVPLDPEYIKIIMTKDFSYFDDRGFYYNERDDPLSANLFSMKGGEKWRNLRAKLTPTFTSGKMRAMFQILTECSENMIKYLNMNNNEVDIKEIAGKYTTDVIGSAAFGLECNCFEDEHSLFRFYGRKVFTFSPITIFKFFICFYDHNLGRFLRLGTTDKDVAKFFLNTVRETIKFRESNNYKRNDFMQILLELKNDNLLEFNEVAAQAFVFFLAGFETSSATIQFCLFELARNENIQEKLKKEINDVFKKYNGILTYDGLNEMKFLHQVLEETLRMYPPLPMLMRNCTKDYTFPDNHITLKAKSKILIPILALQNDPEYFPNPNEFNPDRFSDENARNIVPYTYLPFGEGPRNCIGKRFGMMQVKVGVALLLRTFDVKLDKKTTVPLVLEPNSFLMNVKSKILLNLNKI